MTVKEIYDNWQTLAELDSPDDIWDRLMTNNEDSLNRTKDIEFWSDQDLDQLQRVIDIELMERKLADD